MASSNVFLIFKNACVYLNPLNFSSNLKSFLILGLTSSTGVVLSINSARYLSKS